MALFGKAPKLLKAGARMPEARLQRLEGGETAVAKLVAGDPALLAFFKVSCPVCQFAMPYLSRLASPDLPVYGISQNDEDQTRGFMQRFGVTFPVLLDPEEDGFTASNAFGISMVPTLFLVEPSGQISRAIEGWSKKDVQWLAERAGTSVFRREESVPEWKAG
jgi:peroxiredoxin